ncbi:MAG: AzlD domain-containing protein [Clostridium sp.]
MGTIEILMIILGMALVTYVPRVVPILFSSKYTLSKSFEMWMKYVPICIFSALLVKEILFVGTEISISLNNEKIWIGLIVGIIACKFRSIALTIASGVILAALFC